MEEYLTSQEFCSRIKYSKQTVYNKIFKKEFVLGEHYIKPSRKKLLFIWSAIQAWMEGNQPPEDEAGTESTQEGNSDSDHCNLEVTTQEDRPSTPAKNPAVRDTPRSSINI